MNKSVRSKETREKITANNKRTWEDKDIRAKRVAGINKAYYGEYTREDYYSKIVKPLIYQGYTFMQMYKQNLICVTNVAAYTLFLEFGKNDTEQVLLNRRLGKLKGGASTKGKAKKTKGKSYEQIYGIEKAKELRECRRKWLKENNIRRFATKVSKPQALLYCIVKTHFTSAVLEEEIKLGNGKSIWLDIAIPDKKINIEYDGIYWHEHNDATISLKDIERDQKLKDLGWKVYRIRSMRNLNEQELINEFNKLQLV